MRIKTIQLALGFIPWLVSCSSPPVVLAPVGPNPLGAREFPSTPVGYLRVYSEGEAMTEGLDEGANPVYQHGDYTVYKARGEKVRHVDNVVGHYASAPRVVSLPPGRYLVKARAKDYFRVDVPVVIRRDRTTNVHLDDQWQPAPGTPKSRLVLQPNGNPVGWRAALGSGWSG